MQGQISVTQALERIRRVAKERKKEKFTSLLHHISIDLLDEAFFELKEEAAPGVDGLTWTEYEQNLDRNIEDLHARVHRGAYRALPSRRVYIPKLTGVSARSRLPLWRTRSSNGRQLRCSTRSTRRISSGSRTGSGPAAARTMRSTRCVSRLSARR